MVWMSLPVRSSIEMAEMSVDLVSVLSSSGGGVMCTLLRHGELVDFALLFEVSLQEISKREPCLFGEESPASDSW